MMMQRAAIFVLIDATCYCQKLECKIMLLRRFFYEERGCIREVTEALFLFLKNKIF